MKKPKPTLERVELRLPRALHEEIKRRAKDEGFASVNAWLTHILDLEVNRSYE